ncbi:MAG: biotin--[acetyl-CoA-carboxylase] ligase [Sediminibacterium sp.]|nr:biotin--[acetyl-CoA-carboxylase] ligase [Sediminibacterium sp.]
MAGHGAAFFAHSQTGGKGQRGKSWITQAGTHVALSVIIDCSFLPLSQQFRASVFTALAVHEVVNFITGGEATIKWPNDIYWRDRKAGGILIENLVRGTHWQGCIVGIGLNVNQTEFPASLPNPVSLKQVTGKEWDTVATARQICVQLQQRFTDLVNGLSGQQLREYNERLYKMGEEVRLRKNNAAFNGRIAGVTGDGELLVAGGMEQSFRFGEVEWVLPGA